MELTAKDIRLRFDELKQERSTIDGIYDLIELYVRPHTGKFFNVEASEHSVQWDGRQLFDSTGIKGARKLASALRGSITPALSKWLDLTWEDEVLQDNHEAKEWLSEASKKVYQALLESDFPLQISKAFLDTTSFGMCYMMLEEVGEETGDLDFTTFPVKNCYFEPDFHGDPMNIYVEYQLKPSECVDKFGDKCPEKARDDYDNGRTTTHKVIFCIFKRENGQPYPAAPEQRAYGWKYVYYEDKSEITSGGYFEQPCMIGKWAEHSDSKYAKSPAFDALPDIKSINEWVKMSFTAAELTLMPPLMVKEMGLFSDVDMQAAGITYVNDVEKSIKPLNAGVDYKVYELKREELKMAIEEAFYVDILQLKDSPQMTATETNARMDIMLKDMGDTFGFIKKYLLDPLVQRAFNILFRAGQLGDMPPIVAERNTGKDMLEIEYLGPLAQAQKQGEAVSVERFFQAVVGIASAEMEVTGQQTALDKLDIDAMVDQFADVYNIDLGLVLSDDEVDELRERRQAEREERLSLENAQMEAETFNTTTQALQTVN